MIKVGLGRYRRPRGVARTQCAAQDFQPLTRGFKARLRSCSSVRQNESVMESLEIRLFFFQMHVILELFVFEKRFNVLFYPLGNRWNVTNYMLFFIQKRNANSRGKADQFL